MKSLAAQRHRVNRAMNFARFNMAEELDLDALADVACLSKFHFTRVFKAHFRETPNQFLARARLELSARRLVYMRDKTITQIALECGFSGSDTFARSFRTRFGSAPRSFRLSNADGFESFEQSPPDGLDLYRPGSRVGPEQAAALRVRVEHRPACRVAYIRHVGPYGDAGGSISDTFTALQRWAGLRGMLAADTSYLGVCPDNASTTPARHCVYDACMLLDGDLTEDDVVSVQTVPAGTYAVLPVECPPQQLNRMWTWLYTDWLPASGRTAAFRPSFEFFARFGASPVSPRRGAELCLPLTD